MNISQVISSLEQTIRKLNAVSMEDGIKDEIRTQITSELEALDWTIDYIKERMVRAVIIIGDPDHVTSFVQTIKSFPRYRMLDDENQDIFCGEDRDPLVVVVMGASDELIQLCRKEFDPEDKNGGLLPRDRLLDYIICHRYHLLLSDDGHRIMFFNISLRMEYTKSIPDLVAWAESIYDSLTKSEQK